MIDLGETLLEAGASCLKAQGSFCGKHTQHPDSCMAAEQSEPS